MQTHCLFVYTRVNGLQGTGGLLILYFILLNSTQRSPCDQQWFLKTIIAHQILCANLFQAMQEKRYQHEYLSMCIAPDRKKGLFPGQNWAGIRQGPFQIIHATSESPIHRLWANFFFEFQLIVKYRLDYTPYSSKQQTGPLFTFYPFGQIITSLLTY